MRHGTVADAHPPTENLISQAKCCKGVPKSSMNRSWGILGLRAPTWVDLGTPGAPPGRSRGVPGPPPGSPGALPGRPGGARGRPGGTPEVISEAIFGVFSPSEFARTFSQSKDTNFHRNSLNFRHAHPCGDQFGLAPRGVISTSACSRQNARVDSKNLEKPQKSSPNLPKINENRSPGPILVSFFVPKSARIS